MLINEKDLVYLDNGNYFMDGVQESTIRIILKLFSIKGEHTPPWLNSPLSQMFKLVSDGESTIRTDKLEYPYDKEKGIFIGDPFWVEVDNLEKSNYITKLLALTSRKNQAFLKKGNNYFRLSPCKSKLQYLRNNYDKTYKMCEMPIRVLNRIEVEINDNKIKIAQKKLNEPLYDLSQKEYTRICENRELNNYGFTYVDDYPVNLNEDGYLRIEIYNTLTKNNFDSLTVNYETLLEILNDFK